MGGALSHFFQSGHALLSSSHNRNASEQTRRNIRIIFDALCANPKVGVQRLDGLLCSIPRSENILQIHNEEGYNLLQICVGLNNLELIRWCLSRNIDINRGACSLPLHIACLKGYVGLLLAVYVPVFYEFLTSGMKMQLSFCSSTEPGSMLRPECAGLVLIRTTAKNGEGILAAESTNLMPHQTNSSVQSTMPLMETK